MKILSISVQDDISWEGMWYTDYTLILQIWLCYIFKGPFGGTPNLHKVGYFVVSFSFFVNSIPDMLLGGRLICKLHKGYERKLQKKY